MYLLQSPMYRFQTSVNTPLEKNNYPAAKMGFQVGPPGKSLQKQSQATSHELPRPNPGTRRVKLVTLLWPQPFASNCCPA